MPMIVATVLALLLALWFLGQPWLAERRRRRWRAQPFPAAWRRILRRRVPLAGRLPAPLQLQLKQRINEFLAEVPFIGCNGLKVTDEMRVTVAAQASLLLLNRPGVRFDALRQVLLYPGAFVVDRVRTGDAGVQHDDRRVLSGESWSQGQVLLSWADVLQGAGDPGDGRNVVIHEFAHQLDQANGAANGAPALARRSHYARWSQVLGTAFAELRHRHAVGEPTLFDAYGATEPAEFFAVASEVFFEQPVRMAAEHPALYAEFRLYYQVDPAAW
ncbi:M90 family metallopeptidase [Aquincola sp. MAHUQ-54]|uniref:M90 family metallopeptidase n=2 Tax=Aquincola TaxID=391952 RepID=A0AAW9Q607_9BURK